MRTLIIFTDYFLPGSRGGGPITSVSNLFKLICKKFHVVIVTRNTDFCETHSYDNVIYDELTEYEVYSVIYLSKTNSKTVLEAINKIRPDVIYLNSIFSVFTRLVLLQYFLNKIGAKLILAPRGELQKNALVMKRYKKFFYISLLKFFRVQRRILFHATDKIEFDRINEIFSGANIRTLPNISRVVETIQCKKNKNELKIIFISRIRSNKNLLYALEVLSRCSYDISFDMYGPIEDKVYWKKCLSFIETLPKNVMVSYKGAVSSELIPLTFRGYHALLLPTETENFGHVIVEAMQAGVVPIISDQTPWRDLARLNAGWDIQLDRPDLFLHAVTQLYEMDASIYQALSQSTSKFIKKQLNFDELARGYNSMFNQKF